MEIGNYVNTAFTLCQIKSVSQCHKVERPHQLFHLEMSKNILSVLDFDLCPNPCLGPNGLMSCNLLSTYGPSNESNQDMDKFCH